eukprot:2687207-Heterocapsa_arctica.AAC.1
MSLRPVLSLLLARHACLCRAAYAAFCRLLPARQARLQLPIFSLLARPGMTTVTAACAAVCCAPARPSAACLRGKRGFNDQ